MGGCDDSDIHLNWVVAAQALHRTLLKDTQKAWFVLLPLKVNHLVKENGK